MKISDIPSHVLELDPPYFTHEYFEKFGSDPDPVDDEVTPLFHLNYYDGPLSGIVVRNNHYFYVQPIYSEDRCWWAAWELTPEETQTVLAEHELFEKYVGLHTTYTKNSQGKYVRDLNTVKPQESWEKYYKNDQIVKANYNLVKSRDIFGILENPFWSR